MNHKAGNHTPAELASLLTRLKEKVNVSRRENLWNFLEDLESLAEQIRAELHLDESLLEQVKVRYRQEFSFLDRINPFNEERRQAHHRSVAPASEEVQLDRALLTRCCELLEWVRNASQPIEWRNCWHGGIAGVYNEHAGQAEWREAWHTGIAGVYHPDLQCVE